MLDEKRTAAAMKEAWRKGGYRFVLSSGILSVRAEGWGFQGKLENIPNKVLGLITEHFGFFPEDGDCFELKKDEAEQSVMYDQEASWWEQIRGLFDEDHAAMLQTPLLLSGFEIWQEQRGLKTQMIDPDRTRIIEAKLSGQLPLQAEAKRVFPAPAEGVVALAPALELRRRKPSGALQHLQLALHQPQ